MEKYIDRRMIEVKELAKYRKYGEKFFTLKPCEDDPKESIVWVLDEYDRSEKAYYCYRFSDINHGKYIKGNKQVFVGFTF